MVTEQQNSTESFLSKESLHDLNIVIDMKKSLQKCPLVLPSICKNHYCNS